MKNILTFDLEDWEQIICQKWIGKQIPPSSDLKNNLGKILAILDEYKTKATFFVLGRTAEFIPELIKGISNRGHEIASHGYEHKPLFQQSPESFRQELKSSVKLLKEITGQPPIGFRAPAFSISKKTWWAIKILTEEGFQYDSSIFPILHRRYGIKNAPRFPYFINTNGKQILEFPISTYSLVGINLPFSGGGYLRLLPLSIIKKFIQKLNAQNQPVIVYLHPYELSKTELKIKDLNGLRKLKFNLYKFSQNIGRNKSKKKLGSLLENFEFTSVKKYTQIHTNMNPVEDLSSRIYS